MKTCRDGLSGNHFLRVLICTVCFGAGFSAAALSQVNTVASEDKGTISTKPAQDFTVRVAVEEVRIDAVVVDNKGRQITDLTTDDFELYQDDKPQKIISSTYITDYQAQPGRNDISRDSSKAALLVSTSMLPRDKIRRTIVFVVDVLSMDNGQLYYTRMSLEKFLESQMQFGDLISIVRTGGGIGALQLFSSDKRQLQSTIKDLHWGAAQAVSGCGPKG